MNLRLAFVTALLLTATNVVAVTGGGSVENVDPSVTSFNGDRGTFENNEAVAEIFSFTIYDDNTEADFLAVKITSTDGTFGTKECTDVSVSTSCPAWTFTDSVANDGTLSGTYTYTWPISTTANTYTQTFTVRDEGGYITGTNEQTIIEDGAFLTIETGVYDAAGSSTAGNWGGWSAAPAATEVDSINYLKITNAGGGSGQINVNFGDVEFTGATGTIAIDNNIQFSIGTGASPSNGLADEPTSTDGSGTFAVPASGVLWIGYEIQTMPNPIADGSYTASYTVTEL